MWKVSDGHVWIQYDGGAVTGDPDSLASVSVYAGQPVPLATMAGVYEPTDTADEVGLFLLARHLIPAGTALGTPPEVPAAEYAAGDVY